MQKILILLTLGGLLAAGGVASARSFYVRVDGSDANSGLANTPQAAWQTLDHAALSVRPGDVVEVQAGTYPGGTFINVRGTEKLPITFKANGKVIINTTNPEGYARFCLALAGSHIVIDGFDISRGGCWGGGIFLAVGATRNIIRNNTIHDSLRGVGVFQAGENTLINNTFYSNGCAVGIWHSSDAGHSVSNVIVRNTFYDNTLAIYVARARGTEILGNIIYGCKTNGIYLSKDEYGNPKYLLDQTELAHNLVVTGRSFGILQDPGITGTVLNCNLFWGNAFGNYSGIAPGKTDLNADPLFIAPAEKNFNLQAASPCYPAGIYPPPQTFRSAADKWGRLGGYLDQEFAFQNTAATPAIGRENVILTVNSTVVSKAPGKKAAVKFELFAPDNRVFAEKQALLLAPGENNIRQAINVPAAMAGEYCLNMCLLDENGRELCKSSCPVPEVSCLHPVLEKPAYRNTVFTAQPDREIVVRLKIDAEEENLRNKELLITLEDEAGQATLLVAEKAPQPDRPYCLPANGLKAGNYALGAALRAGGKNIDRAAIPLKIFEPFPGYAYIDAEGRLLIDGKRFFPIGMYNANPTDFPYFQAAGFNAITYSIGYSFKDIARIQKDLAEAARHGFKVSVDSTIGNHLDKPRNDYLSRIEDMLSVAQAIKTNSAIFTWLINEEAGYTESQEKLYAALAKADPHHPISCNGTMNAGARSLYNITDIFQCHYYPYPLYANASTANWARIESTLEWVKHTAATCNLKSIPTAPGNPLAAHRKPFIYWPQYFWGGYWAHGGVGRFPTYPEMRYIVWSAFMEGAAGICFWAYWHDYTNPRMNPSLWEGVRAIADEMASLEPVLTAPDEQQVRISPALEKNFHWRAKRLDREVYVFAAQSGEKPLEVTFRLPPDIRAKRVRCWSQDQTLAVRDGQFRDVLPANSLAIYTTARQVKKSKAIEFLKDPFFTETPAYKPPAGNLAYGQPVRLKEPKGGPKGVQIGATSCTSKAYTWFPHDYFAIDGDPHTCWFPVYDGKLNPAWDNPVGKDAPWLEVAFPKTATISRIVVKSYLPRHWSDPPGNLQDYDLQYLDANASNKWTTIVQARNNKQETSSHSFAPVSTARIRLVAHKGLYLSELEAYEQ